MRDHLRLASNLQRDDGQREPLQSCTRLIFSELHRGRGAVG